MHGTKLNWLKKGISMVTAACLMAAVTVVSYAAASAVVLEQRMLEDSLLLYVKHSGEEQKVQAHIGTESGVKARVTDSGDLSVVTWLLMDNSLSISGEDRETAKRLLTDLVAGRAQNERFNLCTFSDKLTVLLEDSQNYTELKAQIDQLEHEDQETYLTDVLSELLDREMERDGDEFVRVIIISDGVDNNPGGLTREELLRRLKEQAIPIYTLGSVNQNNGQNLKEMYALSRQTNGLSWTLGELTDTLSVVQAMSGAELPVCVEVEIPEALQDGSVKGVQLTFRDGAVAETQATMPFGIVKDTPVELPADHSDPAPDPQPEPEPEPDSEFPFMLLIVILAATAVLVAGVAAFLLIRRKKEKNRIEPVELNLNAVGGGTELNLPGELPGGDTMLLINNDRRLILKLIDRTDPNRHFEVPLCGKVTIGRSPSNQIVLDYERSVSGTHCEVFVAGNIFKIRDLGSKNGTYVDGIQVGDVAEISSGSVLKLGRLELMVDIR